MKIKVDQEFLLKLANSQTELKFQVDKIKDELKNLAQKSNYKIEATLDNPADIQFLANELSPIFMKYKVSKVVGIKT